MHTLDILWNKMQFRQHWMAENTLTDVYKCVQRAITFDSDCTETAWGREIYVNIVSRPFSCFLVVLPGILCHYLFWGFFHIIWFIRRPIDLNATCSLRKTCQKHKILPFLHSGVLWFKKSNLTGRNTTHESTSKLEDADKKKTLCKIDLMHNKQKIYFMTAKKIFHVLIKPFRRWYFIKS